MRAIKERKRELDMIFPFSPVAWNHLVFYLRKMWRYFQFHFQSPSFRHHVHLPTVTPDINIWVCRLDAKERTDRQIPLGVFFMGNNPHYTKCARDEMKTAVFAAAGCCVNVEAAALELKVNKDWQLGCLESVGQFSSPINRQSVDPASWVRRYKQSLWLLIFLGEFQSRYYLNFCCQFMNNTNSTNRHELLAWICQQLENV